MVRTTIQPRGQVTIPKAVRERASVRPGDTVDIRVDDDNRIVIEPISAKPLEYFWTKFASDVPYDDDAIRAEWQALAAAEAMGE